MKKEFGINVLKGIWILQLEFVLYQQIIIQEMNIIKKYLIILFLILLKN